MNDERVFHGLPHPRKESGDQTAYFLGEKERGDLHKDTNPERIDAARDYLRNVVAALGEIEAARPECGTAGMVASSGNCGGA